MEISERSVYWIRDLKEAIYEAKDLAWASEIIQDGIDCNCINLDVLDEDYNINALCMIAEQGLSKSVELILTYLNDSGTNIKDLLNRHLGWDKKAALNFAAKNGHLKVVRLLIEAGCDVNIGNEYGKTALHFACDEGHYDVVKLLIDSDCNIDQAKYFGEIPIHSAAKFGRLEIVRLLLDHGCNKDMEADFGMTAVHFASQRSYLEVVKLLLEYKCVCDIKDINGMTPLHLAAKYGHSDVIHILLDAAGCSINIRDASGNTPLHLSALYNKYDAVKTILSYRSYRQETKVDNKSSLDINASNHDDQTALHAFIFSKDAESLDIVKELIESGIDLNQKDCFSNSVLNYAAQCDKIDMVQYLVTLLQCDTTKTDDVIRSCCIAAENGNPMSFVYLLQQIYGDAILPHKYPCGDNSYPYSLYLDALKSKITDLEYCKLILKDNESYLLDYREQVVKEINNNLRWIKTIRRKGDEIKKYQVHEEEALPKDVQGLLHRAISVQEHKISKRAQIGKKIGSGGFGEVYNGISFDGDREIKIAIKCIQLQHNRKNYVTMTNDEASKMKTMIHTNVVKLLGTGIRDINGDLCLTLCMELCKEDFVRYFIKDGKKFGRNPGQLVLEKDSDNYQKQEVEYELALWNVIDVAIQIMDGLIYLHNNGIIHRDLKLANILMSFHGEAKITDFGLASFSWKTVKELVGTYLYLAPEILTRQKYSKASDVYSFSLIVFEIFYGAYYSDNMRFSDLSKKQIEEEMKQGNRPCFSDTFPPKKLKMLIEDGWSQLPEKRPNSLTLVNELRSILDNIKSRPSFHVPQLVESQPENVTESDDVLFSSQISRLIPLPVTSVREKMSDTGFSSCKSTISSCIRS